MISDGCTGFWLFEAFFHIHDCCVVHDGGGSDLDLIGCLMQNLPPWAWPVMLVCVALMMIVRPVYQWLKRKLG